MKEYRMNIDWKPILVIILGSLFIDILNAPLIANIFLVILLGITAIIVSLEKII